VIASLVGRRRRRERGRAGYVLPARPRASPAPPVSNWTVTRWGRSSRMIPPGGRTW